MRVFFLAVEYLEQRLWKIIETERESCERLEIAKTRNEREKNYNNFIYREGNSDIRYERQDLCIKIFIMIREK